MCKRHYFICKAACLLRQRPICLSRVAHKRNMFDRVCHAGDLGTSPLYTIPASFSFDPTPEDIVGVISLILWTLTAIYLVKYTLIVLHADDHGQGA